MNRTLSERALVLAPLGRDADIAVATLAEAKIDAAAVGSLTDLVATLRGGAGFAVVTEEALQRADVRGLVEFLAAQEEWSDFPFILLTPRGGGLERNPAAQRFLTTLGNVTFLERPFHPTTLVSLARAALRARRRQYDARARLQTLNDAQEELRIALAAGGLGAWTVTLPDATLRTSPACRAQYGFGPNEAFSYDDLRAIIHPDDGARMAAAIQASLADGVDYDIEYRIKLRDGGAVRWVHVAGRPSYGADGAPTRMTGVSQDITERKENEARLRDSNADLEARVEQRTHAHAAAMAQLHEAQKMETIGQLTGGVAHDFNNLLTPIVGGLDMLKRMHADDRSQRIIGGAVQSADRATTLVARLLSFSRRQNLEARAVDPTALVEGVLDLIRRSLGPQIVVRTALQPGLPAAFVDPNQLELALLNLAVNARDAMPGGGELRIETSRFVADAAATPDLPPGEFVRFAVSDTGTGMDAETIKRAIEPFYSTKGIGKGTGLGLSMVHGLAGQSGGTMRIESTPGVGTTVELFLPATAEPAWAGGPRTDDVPVASRPLRILLVDDEELVRRGTADMLASMGHEVAEAPSPATALAMVQAADYDLLVTDYLMPKMNGIALIRAAQQLKPDLPVILITGFADVPDNAGAGIVRLAKPFRQAQLATLIARVG